MSDDATDNTPLQPAEPIAAGEEWRAMDGSRKLYDPGASDAVLKAANEGIERYRKGTARLRLVDAAGNPLSSVAVSVEQLKSDFVIGEQLWALDAMYRDGEQATGRARAWQERFLEIFNGATNLCYWTERFRNDASKTEERQGEPRVENFAQTVEWCLANGILAKGHPLFWSIPKCTPDWVKRYDLATQMKFAEVRVRNLVARFKGRIKMWDAVNEALWEPAPCNLGKREWPHLETLDNMVDYISTVLRWCREEDPDAQFLVNDYGTENESPQPVGSPTRKVTAAQQRSRFIELANGLREHGYAPDALGLQSHTGWVSHHAEQTRVYDDYAEAGWPVHITEFWAHLDSLQRQFPDVPLADLKELQAVYVDNYLTVAYGHPAVGAFFFWGFMGMAIDFKERSGHDLAPVFERIRKRVREDWRTTLQLHTDADGCLEVKGFYGSYSLRYSCSKAEHISHGVGFEVRNGFDGLQTLVCQHAHGRAAR
jgi:GH35 family endo-1,4-beta-xylanase